MTPVVYGSLENGCLIPCRRGPSTGRLVTYPPPFEIDEGDGTYVLVDDGPPERWVYEFVPR